MSPLYGATLGEPSLFLVITDSPHSELRHASNGLLISLRGDQVDLGKSRPAIHVFKKGPVSLVK
ncbi:hypothetical protein ACXR0O_23570 [Verrucomicrobiota bacterium sgz303538]